MNLDMTSPDMVEAIVLAWLLNSLYAVGALAIVGSALAIGQRFFGGRIGIANELHKDNKSIAIVVAAVVIGVCLVVSSAHGGQAEYPTRYDKTFKKYGIRFFARSVDWRWFKAQGIAESNLNPRAISPAGARGVMQIMDPTGREQATRLGVAWLPHSPRISIMLGIAYDRRLWGLYGDQAHTRKERRRLMFAGYNAGPGNIGRATEMAMCRHTWGCVMMALPEVTGRHAMETAIYIRRIERIYQKLARRKA